MKRAACVSAAIVVLLIGCTDGTEPTHPAIGAWDQVLAAGQTPRTATCGTHGVVNGAVFIEADRTFLKVDLHTTPGGSTTCGYVGGTWVRRDGRTLELVPDPSFPFGPVEITVQGDELTFQSTGQVYARRP